jgi:hypothetical protein
VLVWVTGRLDYLSGISGTMSASCMVYENGQVKKH